MAASATISHLGSLTSCTSVGALEVFNTGFLGTFANQKNASPTLSNVTSGSPLSLPFESITKVNVLACKSSGGALTLMLTTSAGADQLVPLGSNGVFVYYQPTPGSELTAIKVYGTGHLEYWIAGS